MLSLTTATALKTAGLDWQPTLHDFFAIPNTDMDDRVFVLTDVMVDREILQGWPAFTFNGAVEWALDYILQADAVWIPREDQLREAVLARVAQCSLVTNGRVYRCAVEIETTETTRHTFSAATAPEAYASALLHLIHTNQPLREENA